VDYLQVLLENRAILWKKRRLIQTAAAQAAEESEDFRIESLQRIPEWFPKKIMKTFSRPMPGLREDLLRGCMELRESGRRSQDLKSTTKQRANRKPHGSQPSQIRWRCESSYLCSDHLRCAGRSPGADHLQRCRSVESSVDDLRTGRGVVLGRAVPTLRSVRRRVLTWFVGWWRNH
jgi:hypothetical protein